MKHIGKCGRTGKVDINETEILDGDILEYPEHPDPYAIKWSDEEAGFVCGNSVNPDDGEPYRLSAMFKVGDKVQLSYCDDTTVYEIDKTKWSDGRYIYHLLDVQGWKAGINLTHVLS